MPTTETRHPGEFLISEASGTRSRSTGTIASGQGVVPAGQVLGRVTASGKLIKYSNAASDGSQTAVGILYASVDATSADTPCIVIDLDAEVAASKLTGLDAAGTTDLAALGFKVR